MWWMSYPMLSLPLVSVNVSQNHKSQRITRRGGDVKLPC